MTELDVSNAKIIRQIKEQDNLTKCNYTLTFYSLVVDNCEGRCYEIKRVCDNEQSVTYGTADDLIEKYNNSTDPTLNTLAGKTAFVQNYVQNLNAIPFILIIKILVFLLLELFSLMTDISFHICELISYLSGSSALRSLK